jgi:tetratricopeptide (TPR) repeat protein
MKHLVSVSMLIGLLVWLLLAFSSLRGNIQEPLRFPTYPPSVAIEMMSLGNRELAATLIFYNAQFYFGEKYAWRREAPEYQRLFVALDKATDLDPRNMDCYYFAQGLFSDIKPAIPVLNRLLEKGMRHRKQDWYLPFFISANYYFQLKDPVKAAEYLQRAAVLNPDNALFASLSARMLYQGNQTKTAITYLEAFIKETRNPAVRKKLLLRLRALTIIHFLENAITDFTEKKGRPPRALDEVVTAGLIDKIPADPYGGTFFLDETGKVYTTSKLTETWGNHDNRNQDQQSQ